MQLRMTAIIMLRDVAITKYQLQESSTVTYEIEHTYGLLLSS